MSTATGKENIDSYSRKMRAKSATYRSQSRERHATRTANKYGKSFSPKAKKKFKNALKHAEKMLDGGNNRSKKDVHGSSRPVSARN